VIQAKGGSVKPESAQTVHAAFALPRNAVSLRPRPMARRKRAFVPERRFRIGFPDKRVPPHHGARDVAGA